MEAHGYSSATQPSQASATLFALPLRSIRYRCDKSASAGTLLFMRSTTRTFPLRSWRFICVSSPLMLLSWQLSCVLPIFQHSNYFSTRFSRFLQNVIPSKARRANYIHRLGQWGLPKLLLRPPSERRAEANQNISPYFFSSSFFPSFYTLNILTVLYALLTLTFTYIYIK